MSAYDEFLLSFAITFIRNGLPNYLAGTESQLVDGCSEYLQTRQGVPARTAERISMMALAEVQSRKGGLIDMEMSNSHIVFLRDDKKVFAFPAWRLKEIASEYGVSLKLV